MRKLIPVLVLLIIQFSCSDEDGTPAPNLARYIDTVFTDVKITSNIQYGSNESLGGVTKNLFLDVYEPVDDTLSERPTLILAHGGAFVGGNKSDLEELCTTYALMGYTAVSVGYNLIDDRFVSDSVRFSKGVVIAIGDMKGAIRFIRDNAINGSNDYGVDPDMIIAGGISAGAIMANHVGFWDEDDTPFPDYLEDHVNENGGFEGDTNDLDVSSEVHGILSFSGSLFRDAWIEANDPPAFIVHEENDPIVPCGYETTDAFPFAILAYGGCEIHSTANAVGLANQFILFENSSEHVGYLTGDESLANEIITESAEFMAGLIAN